MRRFLPIGRSAALGLLIAVSALSSLRAQETAAAGALPIFNVKDFGATGVKTDMAREAIQRAVDACAQAGGGMVYVPPGEYTSGTIHLRSRVRFVIESGAVLFASREKQDFDKEALFYGEDLVNITIEGRGLVDGQSEYEWRLNDLDDRFIRDNQLLMEGGGSRSCGRFRSRTPCPRWFCSCAAGTFASPASASCTRRAGPSIPTAANAWSSTAFIFTAA
jgi:polygalacturonase